MYAIIKTYQREQIYIILSYLQPGAGGKLVRSAGSFVAQISGTDDNYCIIKLKSGEIRKIINQCSLATIGTVSNADHQNIKIGKAGRNKMAEEKDLKPEVLLMNPVDHPHGGGEGKTSGGRQPSISLGAIS